MCCQGAAGWRKRMWRQLRVQHKQRQLLKSLVPPRHIHTAAEHRLEITHQKSSFAALLSCPSKMWAVPDQGRNVFLPPFLFWCISLPCNLQRDHLGCSNALLRKDCIVLPVFMPQWNVPLPVHPCAWPVCDKAEASFLSSFHLAFTFLFPASFGQILICVYNKTQFPHVPFVV